MITTTKLPFSYIVSNTKWDLFWVLIVSVISYITFQYLIDIPDMGMSIPAFLGTSISLIIGFKLSHSYDRWWEARKIWGAIVNDSRSLTIQLKNFVSAGEGDKTVIKMANRQIAWAYSFGQALRGQDSLSNTEEFLDSDEYEELKKHNNIPFTLLNLQGEDLASLHQHGKINDYQQIQIDKTIVRLVESMGKAERIKKTVFPTTYRIYLHLSIYIFVVMLAEAMAETAGIWEIPRLLAITTPFFFMEKTAYFLQDPFEGRPTDTPVTSIARSIQINIMQILKMDNVPEPLKNESYYVM